MISLTITAVRPGKVRHQFSIEGCSSKVVEHLTATSGGNCCINNTNTMPQFGGLMKPITKTGDAAARAAHYCGVASQKLAPTSSEPSPT